MTTHREALLRLAEESGTEPDEFLRVYLGSHFHPDVPERYRRLVADVLWRLPEAWDAAREWSVEISAETSPKGYASARREEEGEGEIEQLWIVTLYPALLDRLSDAACRYPIAHEFGHVASGLSMGSISIDGTRFSPVKGTANEYEEATSTDDHEDVAELIVMEWGFSGELATFLKEDQPEAG